MRWGLELGAEKEQIESGGGGGVDGGLNEEGFDAVFHGGLGGLNQADREMGFIALVVVANGDASVVAENSCVVVGFPIPIHVIETGLNEAASGFDVADFNGGACLRGNRKADCDEDLLGFFGGDLHDGVTIGRGEAWRQQRKVKFILEPG